MKLALFSDIHGHGIALEAVLAAIGEETPDKMICLGDVATIGPQPCEVLSILKTLDCVFIQGNHDAAVVTPENAPALNIAPQLADTLLWGINQLGDDDLAFIESFVPSYTVQLNPATALHCFHGSPTSTVDLILATTPPGELDRLLAPEPAAIMAGGHTHVQMLRQHRGRLIVNPGSVGQPFVAAYTPSKDPVLLPFAEYALITASATSTSITLHRVPFDVAAFHEVVRTSDIPIAAWWLQQYRQ